MMIVIEHYLVTWEYETNEKLLKNNPKVRGKNPYFILLLFYEFENLFKQTVEMLWS